jgi:hypothetical protein
MDLILRPSGGRNIVLRPQARATWYPTATVDAHEVEVFWQELDADGMALGAPLSLGLHAPDARVTISYNPVSPDRKVRVYARAFSASGVPDVAELRDATQATVLFERTTVAVGGIDEHVPTVTLAPTIAKAEGTTDWIVITPAPSVFAATVKYGEIRVEKASDASVFEVWGLSVSKQERIPQKAFPCKISYRWWNQSGEDAGNGEGWSDWSPQADAPEEGNDSSLPAAGAAVTDVDFDPGGSMAGIERGVIVG